MHGNSNQAELNPTTLLAVQQHYVSNRDVVFVRAERLFALLRQALLANLSKSRLRAKRNRCDGRERMLVTMNRVVLECLILYAALASACGGSEFSAARADGGAGGAAAAAGSRPQAGSASDGAGEGGAIDGAPRLNECPCAAPRPTCVRGKCVARGPSMLKAGSLYVDSTEVTVANYAAFMLAKAEDTSNQSAVCAWNDSYQPATPGKAPNLPVTNVDFCDALAYCAWADKQLCGKIGVGALAFASLSDPTTSQWALACGGPKARLYPYGTTFQAGVCNSVAGSLKEVGASERCGGFYAGVYDLVGNAAEWVNACDASLGSTDGCETIGGSYADDGTCTLSSLKHRDEQMPTVGFRCCSK